MKEQELVPVPRQSQGDTLMTIIERAATSADFDVDKLQKLLDLKERWEKAEAQKAYNEAIAAFKAEGVKIVKNKRVRFQTKTGGMTDYKHATLGEVVEHVTPILSKYGLSHTWNVHQTEKNIEVICKISHVQGHAETVTMSAEADDSGGKNRIQQIGSTVSYLQRYTILSALGLATYDQDDDGKGAEVKKTETISDEQIANIEALLLETGADGDKFCTFMKVEEIADIPAKAYNTAIRALEAKRGK